MAEVDETVDIVCHAMGECGEATGERPRGGAVDTAFPGAKSSSLGVSSAIVRKDFGAE